MYIFYFSLFLKASLKLQFRNPMHLFAEQYATLEYIQNSLNLTSQAASEFGMPHRNLSRQTRATAPVCFFEWFCHLVNFLLSSFSNSMGSLVYSPMLKQMKPCFLKSSIPVHDFHFQDRE